MTSIGTGNDWTPEEVEAIVADHLDMLALERAGVSYNKTEHRRALQRLLRDRTDGSIERKHQNISAVLSRLGIPCIEGYKPLGNFQRLLYEVVVARVEEARDLLARVANEVVQPASTPTMDDILAALVDPPASEKSWTWPATVSSSSQTPRIVNYLEIESRNRSLGAAGEEFVMRYEVARLVAERAERFAAQVERVSATQGDGLGYDVLSFDRTGREKLIEVKTTAYARETPFFVSSHELNVSRETPENYHICRVFDFRKRPRLYFRRGQIDQAFALDPMVYSARLR
ncbi:MAG: DUF3883 domain-containing protein [Gemmatimonadota bacterium]